MIQIELIDFMIILSRIYDFTIMKVMILQFTILP
jgi:hypothetical protein